ncbi:MULTISPECIES: hypothetical protein [unclassified Carboxylicivirga]|uniref:hypothetical protein n=1 Tax=Carboxylicivirga TaxID=1628153 RepID=UPI003D33001C
MKTICGFAAMIMMVWTVNSQNSPVPVFKGNHAGQSIYAFINDYIAANELYFDEVSVVGVSFVVGNQGQVKSIKLLDEVDKEKERLVKRLISATSGYWEQAYGPDGRTDFTFDMSLRIMPPENNMQYAIYQFKRGIRFLNNKEFDKAKKCFDRSESILADHPGVNYVQIITDYQNGHQDKALARYVKLQKQDRFLVSSLQGMGEQYADLTE